MLGNVPNFSRTRTAPTGYEKVRLIFHAIRTAQLISSIIVGSIVIYFLWWLVHDNEARPWTFIFLTVTSFLTVIVLTATLVAHCLTGLNPRVNLALNLFNLCLWILSYSMLTYWSWRTLTNACDKVHWLRDEGVMICEVYKALFSFALIGLVATAAAVSLDIHIYRLATRFGTHMRLDNLDQKPRVVDTRIHSYVDEEGRRSEAFEVPQAGYGAQKAQLLGVGEGEGYDRPSGQFSYDTGYHGGHADRVFGAEH